MNIVCFGINKRGVEILKHLIENGYNVTAVVSEAKKSCEEFINTSKRYSIPVLTFENINSDESYNTLKNLNADIFLIISYNQILKDLIIKIPKLGVFNCHGGKLPEYRGSSVLNWQIIKGEKKIGISIIKVDCGIDSGAIAKEAQFRINLNDDINYVTDKSIELFKDLVIDLLKDIENNRLKLKKQDEKKAQYYCKRLLDEGKINWQNMTDLEIHNLVRALTKPACGGAFCFYNNEKIFIWRTELLKETIISTPGKVCLMKDCKPIIMAKNRGILIADYEFSDSQQKLQKNFFVY
ncbi:MAG TPA: methionyl-tRNA formyltransferase [bacterium]|nr:methionyl-tRNA formyltransferase [bacterium]